MLKSYAELKKVDVRPYCDVRQGKDDRGKTIDLLYLNWAKCLDLLHENGAEVVYWTPVAGPNGSSLIQTDKVFTDSKGNTNSVYETKIHIVIDDQEWDAQGAVMNGSNPVKDNSMSQQRLWNAQTRLFVKSVAMRTGLGFDLWCGTETAEEVEQKVADQFHDIRKVKERVFEIVTALNKKGMTLADIAAKMNKSDVELKTYLAQYDILYALENNLTILNQS